MSKKTRITVDLPENVYADLQSYKEERFFNSDATAVLSLVVRELYNRELEKLNKD